MLGEIGCVRWVSGLPCSQRSRACQGEMDLRYCLSACLPFFATPLGSPGLQILSRRHGNSIPQRQ
jgi:hypothetical protein